jgi:predicted  nucleic acid-binding Zn-ribbon protein
MRLAKWVLCGAALMSIGFGASIAAQAGRPQEPEVLSALLTEVRGLRQAMEQMAAVGPRVQLAFGRLQLQEQRVNTAIRRLETLRDAVAKAEKDVATTQVQLSAMENMFKSGDASPDDRNPMSAMIATLKKAVAAGTADVMRLQGEEAQLQQQIATEQGRWEEINRALEDLERAFRR